MASDFGLPDVAARLPVAQRLVLPVHCGANLLCEVARMKDLLVPPMDWPLELSDQQLGLDLVETTISGILIEGDASRSMSALERLNELQVVTADGHRVPLFNKSRPRAALRPLTAIIRTERVKRNGVPIAPVFSGQLIATRGRLPTYQYAGSRECVWIKLRLKLNVPRFISAQKVLSHRFGTRTRAAQPFALAGVAAPMVEDDEVAFGSDGNVIMGDDEVYRYAASKPAVEHLRDLIGSILEIINRWLNQCLQTRNNRVTSNPTFTLAKVEWYAEFRAHDPRRHVARLIPILSRQGRVGNVYRRRLTGQVRTFGKHSYAMQIELANGIKQTTYSKTNRRVRFEMKYGRQCYRRLIGRRSRLTEDQFAASLNSLREHADTQLSRIFEALTTGIQPSPQGSTRDDLVLCIGHFTEHLAFSEEILCYLRDTGRVVAENGSILRPSVNALIETDVLRFERYAVYTVTEEFEAALRELMAEPGAAMEVQMRAI